MALTQEGAKTIIVSREQLYDMENAQREIMYNGIINPNSNTLAQGLSLLASILTFFVIKAPTPVGVSLSAVSLGLSMYPNEKTVLEDLSDNGRDYLLEMAYFMKMNPQYDYIEIKHPYLKYIDVNDEGEDITFVTGRGILTRAHTSGGWEQFTY